MSKTSFKSPHFFGESKLKLLEVFPSLRRRYPVQVLRVHFRISADLWLPEVFSRLPQNFIRSRNTEIFLFYINEKKFTFL